MLPGLDCWDGMLARLCINLLSSLRTSAGSTLVGQWVHAAFPLSLKNPIADTCYYWPANTAEGLKSMESISALPLLCSDQGPLQLGVAQCHHLRSIHGGGPSGAPAATAGGQEVGGGHLFAGAWGWPSSSRMLQHYPAAGRLQGTAEAIPTSRPRGGATWLGRLRNSAARPFLPAAARSHASRALPWCWPA